MGLLCLISTTRILCSCGPEDHEGYAGGISNNQNHCARVLGVCGRFPLLSSCSPRRGAQRPSRPGLQPRRQMRRQRNSRRAASNSSPTSIGSAPAEATTPTVAAITQGSAPRSTVRKASTPRALRRWKPSCGARSSRRRHQGPTKTKTTIDHRRSHRRVMKATSPRQLKRTGGWETPTPALV